MFVVQPIRYRHKLLVPPALARFVPTDQQNRSAPRVKGKQHAVRPSSVLNTQFLMLACFDDATESTCGLPRVGPKRRSRFTSALTSTCSVSVKPSHHAPNSSVNSTYHSSKGIYLQKPFPSMVRGDW